MIAILIAVGCKQEEQNPNDGPMAKNDFDTVVIHIRLFEDTNGEKHLEMKDSQNGWVVDSLETFVNPEDLIIWELYPNSGIRKIKEIKGDGSKKIFINTPYKPFPGRKIKLKLTNDIKENAFEKYIIVFRIPWDNKKYEIDPILRVPTGR